MWGWFGESSKNLQAFYYIKHPSCIHLPTVGALFYKITPFMNTWVALSARISCSTDVFTFFFCKNFWPTTDVLTLKLVRIPKGHYENYSHCIQCMCCVCVWNNVTNLVRFNLTNLVVLSSCSSIVETVFI